MRSDSQADTVQKLGVKPVMFSSFDETQLLEKIAGDFDGKLAHPKITDACNLIAWFYSAQLSSMPALAGTPALPKRS